MPIEGNGSISSQCFENQHDEICSHLSEKASKDRFFGLKKILLEGKGRGEKERAKKRKKEQKRKKVMVVHTLSFYNGYFGDSSSFGRKKLLDGKGPLALTFSKIRLDIYV